MQLRWGWGRHRGYAKRMQAGSLEVWGGEELIKKRHSLCASQRKRDTDAAALLLSARWMSPGKWVWLW